jgi:hypothetical protein
MKTKKKSNNGHPIPFPDAVYYTPVDKGDLTYGQKFQAYAGGGSDSEAKKWTDYTVKDYKDYMLIESLFDDDNIRIKYLDIKDIENLGFKHETIDRNGNEIETGKYDYYFRKEDRKDFGTDRRVVELLFRPASDTYLSIVLIRINGDESRSIIGFYRNETLFMGRINNSLELEKELNRVL